MTKQEVQASVADGRSRGSGQSATTGSTAPPPAAASAAPAKTLPKTASSWPLLALLCVLSLGTGLVLTVRRRLAS